MSQYASAQEFYDLSGLSKERLENGPKPVYADTLDRFLRAASELIDGSIAIKYHGSTPLTSWGDAVRMSTIQIAAYYVAKRLGMNPLGDGKSFSDDFDRVSKWLLGIREGTIFLPGLVTMAVKNDYRGADLGLPPEEGGGLGALDRDDAGTRRNFWGYRG